MKLAEALSERRSILSKMDNVIKDSTRQFKVLDQSQGATLTMSVSETMASLTKRLTDLVTRINETNNSVSLEVFGNSMSLMNAIANKDSRIVELNKLQSLKDSLDDDYRTVEHTCDFGMLSLRMNELREDIRVLDLAIQEANWANDLI